MKVFEIINWSEMQLKLAGIENPSLNAGLIISFFLGINRLELNLHADSDISQQHQILIQKAVARNSKREPIQYILGETDFYGLKIKVDKSVLIPRPETEYLVEKIINDNEKPDSILEIGTGSGCIAIALKKHFSNSKIVATDISETALETAAINSEINDVIINFLQSDLFENVSGKFDIIVSNPPYIPKQEFEILPKQILEFEPENALLAADDGLYFYRAILEQAKKFLTKNGEIYFEIGHDQGNMINDFALNTGFNEIEIVKDLNGFDRIVRIKG
ncbi:MAG: protein-(glutamine-N5) methyltransferase, release factor-specific [Candidatus Cloacimonas sp. 4484_143]|nr:MAG: protein-(glutamine-N5) methyltransferase, release factor-specific [Candidatus Cloacimonas sp. 4484_143]